MVVFFAGLGVEECEGMRKMYGMCQETAAASNAPLLLPQAESGWELGRVDVPGAAVSLKVCGSMEERARAVCFYLKSRSTAPQQISIRALQQVDGGSNQPPTELCCAFISGNRLIGYRAQSRGTHYSRAAITLFGFIHNSETQIKLLKYEALRTQLDFHSYHG